MQAVWKADFAESTNEKNAVLSTFNEFVMFPFIERLATTEPNLSYHHAIPAAGVACHWRCGLLPSKETSSEAALTAHTVAPMRSLQCVSNASRAVPHPRTLVQSRHA